MKNDLIPELGLRMAEMGADYLLDATISINMKGRLAVVEIEGCQKTHQTKKVIAVNVCNEYMVESATLDIVPCHLHLRTLAAIQQETLAMMRQKL